MSMSFDLNLVPNYVENGLALSELFTEVHQLGNLGHFCIYTEDQFVITYALYSGCPNMEQTLVYKGCGFSGGLNEMRHTYFSEDGYMFYLEVPLLEASFKILRKYFKFDELS